MTYTNPIIFSDYSDPDVIRVGSYYYMTASSFHVTPGLPLLQSADLVHWNLVGYAVQTIPLKAYDTPQHSKGIWAPSIRYHNNRFIIVVGFPDEGIFVTESTSFYGPWSPLRCVFAAKGFIDPCPFWDEDGNAYIIHGYAKSRIGFNSRLGILAADPDTLVCHGDDRCIFNDEKTQPTIEGPKVYTHNGWYYIFAPAGGVKPGWQTVLRSRSIIGPYEEKIVMRQLDGHINGPHQGGLVDAIDGSWWFLHFQDRGIYGRVSLLEPVVWTDDDWVAMGQGVCTGRIPSDAVDEYDCPPIDANTLQKALPGISAVTVNDSFVDGVMGLQWQWQANARADFIQQTSAMQGLCLAALHNTNNPGYETLWSCAHVLTQKVVYEDFVVKVRCNVSHVLPGSRAGIVFLGGQYASVFIEHGIDGMWRLAYLESNTDEGDSELRTEQMLDSLVLPEQVVSCITHDTQSLCFILRFTPCPIDQQLAHDGWVDAVKPSKGSCVFTVTSGSFTWTPDVPAYSADGDHWVAGRIGLYAQACTNGVRDSFTCFQEYTVQEQSSKNV
ncbi:MAG: glycoside hydrolase 43 family protein [Treponema sp.]|nr:glycoside hydrolase 43 family protein [Treponema sp.]